MSTVVFGVSAFRSVSFHNVEGPLYNLPTTSQFVNGFQRLASDSIGTMNLVLSNLVVDSTIQVETESGVVLSNSVATSSTASLNFNVYQVGSPLNNLVVKVRKGSSSPYYRPWRTQVLAEPGSKSVFVSQEIDE